MRCKALCFLVVITIVGLNFTCGPAHAQQLPSISHCEATERLILTDKLAEAARGVRQQIAAGQVDDALKAAKALVETYPNDSSAQAVLSEALFRRGELALVISPLNKALDLDSCNGRAHFDAWQLFQITGMRESAQKQLDLAHKLDHADTTIQLAWDQQHGSFISGTGSECHLVGTPSHLSVPLGERGTDPNRSSGSTLSVKVNGKADELLLDSADPAITLGEADALRLGLVPEHSFESGPHSATGSGSIHGYTSHLKTLQVGPFTFADCPVEVYIDPPVGRGAIGLEPFHDLLLTLDVQHHQLSFDPLPAAPETEAGAVRDRYISPAMQNWLRFYQPPALHRILLPVLLGRAGTHLFILDTGAPVSHIDPDAAREITTVVADKTTSIYGYGGLETEVWKAEQVKIQVGGVSRVYQPMLSLSRQTKSAAAGVRISGILGFDLVRDLIIQIDFRDLLIKLSPNGQDLGKP